MNWLLRFCRHRFWEPIDARLDEGGYITWTSQRCLRCGKVRDDNLLKPGESIEIPI